MISFLVPVAAFRFHNIRFHMMTTNWLHLYRTQFQAKRKITKTNLWVLDLDVFCWVGVFHMKVRHVSSIVCKHLVNYSYSEEQNRPLTLILLKSIAIRLPFLSRCFCESMPSFWQREVYTPPICITMRLPFVSRHFFAEVLGSGVVGTPPSYIVQESLGLGGVV